jgi:4-aminobutyrate aminotransferase-like enzyme
MLRLLPPLVVERGEIDRALEVLAGAIAAS